MEKTKEVDLFDLVDLVSKGQEKEAIKRYGYVNIWQACKAFPKDKAVQKSFSKIEEEIFRPISEPFFDIGQDIANFEDFAM